MWEAFGRGHGSYRDQRKSSELDKLKVNITPMSSPCRDQGRDKESREPRKPIVQDEEDLERLLVE